MIDIHSTFPESREQLTRLTNVPVDELYVERLKGQLEAHGARFTLIEMKRYPPDGPKRTFFLYAIDFPEGTYREYGMQLLRSTPFTIYFPDGFKQYGANLSSVYAAVDAASTTCLYLVK